MTDQSSPIEPSDVATMIDHTLLAPGATADQIDRLCDDADRFGVATVCVDGRWVVRAAERLASSSVGVCTVVDFPHGADATAAVVAATRAAVDSGAVEVDTVMPLGLLIGGDQSAVVEHLGAIKEATGDRVLKVILESGMHDEDRLRVACRLSERAGADFVKTSTGFHSTGGATVDAVATMRSEVGDRLGVKASGGVRSLDTARAMIEAGATRLGTSSTAAILGLD
ncbi:MAG: deoxyribose-phosphate aldolase [Actinomycetota bacterium]